MNNDNLIEVNLTNAINYTLVNLGVSEEYLESVFITDSDIEIECDIFDFVYDLLDVMQERGLIKKCF